jgi:hypothetical protein
MSKIHYIPNGCCAFSAQFETDWICLLTETNKFQTIEDMMKEFEKFEDVFFSGIEDSRSRRFYFEKIGWEDKDNDGDQNYIYPRYVGLTEEWKNKMKLVPLGKFKGFTING